MAARHEARQGVSRRTGAEPLTAQAPHRLRRVLFTQRWTDVVFLHWEADPFEVARLLPAGTVPDLHHGRAYVGLVFFRMEDLALGRTPPLPYLGSFDEVNVRLYSRDALGRRGVVFRSLDCDRLLPVLAARAGFGLPYRWARTSRRWYDSRLLYRTRRRGHPARPGGRVWLDVGREAVPPGPWTPSSPGAGVSTPDSWGAPTTCPTPTPLGSSGGAACWAGRRPGRSGRTRPAAGEPGQRPVLTGRVRAVRHPGSAAGGPPRVTTRVRRPSPPGRADHGPGRRTPRSARALGEERATVSSRARRETRRCP
ncbi:DUF2071 domain-containing protein [Streptomyces zhihengii]